MEKKEARMCIPVKKDLELAYHIYLEDSFEKLPFYMDSLHINNRKLCIVTDSTVHSLYAEQVKNLLSACCREISIFVFPTGEANKTLDTVRTLYRHLITHHFERKDMLLALGGGVVGDLTGYAAATYLRGIDFIQIPTTLLSQVDSSIGGKTGVDFEEFKNMVGAFHQPQLVYINVNVLKTLSDEQFYCGMGEILKHGLIKDATYYQWTADHEAAICHREAAILKTLISASCEIKRSVVESDPTEQGERALLNFGHTLGHAIEKYMGFQLLHGQCVALGYVAASYISYKRNLITKSDLSMIENKNRVFHLPVVIPGLNPEKLIEITRSDKKMENGKIKFILLDAIGRAYMDQTVSDEEMYDAIQYLSSGNKESYEQ